ncbi:MAG: PPOX class F420-dependent oxidoreductase [Nitriliruptorales bacterium]|nr:PPOX class F420-dependent oxidoreductase [Nitriliruptorales bacterium]
MTTLSDRVREVIDKQTFAFLATVNPDGSPQVSPVWIDRDEDLIVFNTAEGRVKHRNILHDPRVGLSFVDPDNAYRMVAIQGRVVDLDTTDADEHIDWLARKYLGVDTYPNHREDETRVIVRIEPTRVAG